MESPLRSWREARGLSVNGAAEQAGVTAAMWSRWENSRRRIPAERVPQLEERIGIDRRILRPDLFAHPADAPRETEGAAA